MALCKYPIFNKTVGGLTGCGQCFPCRLDRRRKWTLRILLEARTHQFVSWFCLTYQEKYLPREYMDPKTGVFYEHPLGTLAFDDTRLFLNRLRDKLPPRSLRFFLCGEYGDERWRPHYHVIFFGLDPRLEHLVRDSWIDPLTKEQLGDVTLDAADLNAWIAQYTVGYTVKKMTSDKDERLQGRYPEDVRHSQGIARDAVPFLVEALGGVSGLAYVRTFQDVPRHIVFDGKSWPIDRYLREKILEQLQIVEPAKAAGLTRYKKEMLALQLRAKPDPKFQASLAYTLETQYKLENAQRVLNCEKRSNLYKKGDKL